MTPTPARRSTLRRAAVLLPFAIAAATLGAATPGCGVGDARADGPTEAAPATIAAPVNAPVNATPPTPQDPPAGARAMDHIGNTMHMPGLRLSRDPAPPTDPALEAMRLELESLRAESDAMRQKLAALEGEQSGEPDAGPERVSFGGNLIIEHGERVQAVTAYGDDVTVRGHVVGDATSYGGDVTIEPGGYVGGAARALGGDVQVAAGGHVVGRVLAFGGVVDVSDSAVVTGERIALASSADEPSAVVRLFNRLVLLLCLAGTGLLMVGLFPRRVGRVSESVLRHPLRATIVGAIAAPTLLIMAAVLVLPVVTAPISFLMVAGLGLAWLVGVVGLCQALGDRVPMVDPTNGTWMGFLVGFALLALVSAIPVLGVLVLGLASTVGIGAAMGTAFRRS